MTVRCYDEKSSRWMVNDHDGTGWHPEGAPVVSSRTTGAKRDKPINPQEALDGLMRLARAGKLQPEVREALKSIVSKVLASRPLTLKERLAAADRFLSGLDKQDESANLVDWIARKEREAALRFFGKIL